jgi:hypothetical protein
MAVLRERGFVISDLVLIKRAIEPKLKERALARKRAGKKAPAGADAGNVADKLARVFGMSGATLRKAEAVVRAGKRDAARYGALVEEMDRTGRVDGAYRQLPRRRKKCVRHRRTSRQDAVS